MQGSELIAMPEGLIDPMLKTVAFYDGEKKFWRAIIMQHIP